MQDFSQEFQVEFDGIEKSRWTGLLQQFDDASIYQTWSYGAVRWGEGKLSHMVIKQGDEVIGMAQAVIKTLAFGKIGIAYIPWGPLWCRKGIESNVVRFRLIMRALIEEYSERKGLVLRITPVVIANETNQINEVLESEGYELSQVAAVYRTLLLDLSPSLGELRKRLNPKWRNKLNGAEKNSLNILEGSGTELYDIFLKLQKEMLERKEYIPGVDYGEFGRIQKDLPQPLKMRIFVCEYSGEPVACVICSAIGDRGIYLLGATGNKGMDLKGSYLLQWRVIEWLKGQGYHWYDLGGINPERNPGVYQFKAGLSGKDISHIGQFEVKCNRLSSFLVESVENLRSMKRDLVSRYRKPSGTKSVETGPAA
jgi:lipid II:glycine glycyltransferase (peptidoglycan interpeptide bridge formation enzyme)